MRMMFPNSSDMSPFVCSDHSLVICGRMACVLLLSVSYLIVESWEEPGDLRKRMGKTMMSISLLVRLLLPCPTDPSERQCNRENVGLPRSAWMHGSLQPCAL